MIQGHQSAHTGAQLDTKQMFDKRKSQNQKNQGGSYKWWQSEHNGA